MSGRRRAWYFPLLILLLTAGLWPLLTSRTFGSEFSQFFYFVYGKPLETILQAYRHLGGGWYRPTQFHLPFWIGQQLVDWHNVVGWRFLEFVTFLCVVYLITRLVRALVPDRPTAAFFAGLYFGFNPTVYVPLFELFAFDFIHIAAVLLCVLSYLRSMRAAGGSAVVWAGVSTFCYAVALTSKELTLVTPAFLAAISAFDWKGGRPIQSRLRTEALRLLPFAVLAVLYWLLHLRAIPEEAFGDSGDYRTGFNLSMLIRNGVKYPMWLSRIFWPTPDTLGHAAGYMSAFNTLLGASIAGSTLAGASSAWKHGGEQMRRFLVLMVVWIAVFLSAPVYAGGYLWHGNLALCGFCALFGVAADSIGQRLRRTAVKAAMAAGAAAVFLFVSASDTAACIENGIHAYAFRINSSVLTSPPLPSPAVRKGALIYVEDRLGLGWWYYGAGSLFNLVYRDPKITQVLVPKMSEVGTSLCARWLSTPGALFLRYDDHFSWNDGSEEFRRFAADKASGIAPPPVISGLSPHETSAGQPFNVQSNGGSALGVKGSNFEPGSTVVLDGIRVPAVFGGGDWISITVPEKVYRGRRTVQVQVQNPDGQISEPVGFIVH